MRRIFPLLLYASLALAEDYPFWEVKLTSDASRRYMVGVQMATGAAAQEFHFVVTTGTPYSTVAGVGCDSCGGVNSYHTEGSTTVNVLGNSASVNLTNGASTSGPLIQEDCALHTSNGSLWSYPDQTIIMSNESAQVYGGQASGVFGLASGRSTSASNVSLIGQIFGRNPSKESVIIGMALRPLNDKGSDNAGTMHLFGTDTDSYKGTITWKTTTTTLNSSVATFEIDGWKLQTGGNTVTNSNQDLAATVDPYYVNLFFPSQEAQAIHNVVKGSSSQPANNGQSTIYVIPCDTKLSLSTVIGGQSWQVDQKLLVQKQDDGTCVSNIQGWTDVNNKQYIFGSAFLSSLYVVIQAWNPSSTQEDQIGFAIRSSSPSIVAPVVGGVVGGVAGLVIISLGIFFWMRRRGRRKAEAKIETNSGDHGGNLGSGFEEYKDIQPFVPTNVPPTGPTYPPGAQPPHTPRFIEGIPQPPYSNDPVQSRLTPVRNEHGSW